jgi:hypothetical protein
LAYKVVTSRHSKRGIPFTGWPAAQWQLAKGDNLSLSHFLEELMSKFSARKIVCIAVAGVALSLLAANIVRADSFSDQAAKLDVVGVHLGMTPAQAKGVLTQHRKGMSWKEYKGDLGFLGIHEGLTVEGADASWGNINMGLEKISVTFSPPPGDPKVVAISRSVSFEQSQAPSVDNLTSSLMDKFGQPSSKSSTGTFYWAWDKTGQISKANDDVCSVMWTISDPQNRVGVNSSSFIPFLQKEDGGGCAVAARADISSNNSGIANELDMMLVDLHDALPAAIAEDNFVKKVKQTNADAALKKASANKPAL